jgi:hypothetical protein
MNRTFSACLAAAVLLFAPAARGAILFERSLVVDRSVNIFTTSHFDLKFVFGDSFSTPSNPVKLFDGTGITPADAPHLYTSDMSDPAFSAVAARLTDGRDDFVKLTLSEIASGRAEQRGWRESGFFVGHGSNEIPDLKGATIEAILLRLDDFRLVSGGSSTTAVSLPPVDAQFTFTVLGTYVPEPSSLALSGGGLAALAACAYTGRRSRRLS